jgi:hypothetical protein
MEWRSGVLVCVVVVLGVGALSRVTHGQTTFHRIRDFSESSMDFYLTRTQGIGVVYTPFEAIGKQRELILRREPRDTSPVVAYFDYQLTNDVNLELVRAASEPGLIEEVARADHEEYGLVVDLTQHGWVRAIYGYTAKGDIRVGWVKLVPGRVVFLSYEDHIRTAYPYFENPGRVEFFDAPNGRRVLFSLIPDGGKAASYDLRVVNIERDWIQVALNVPSPHPCGDYPYAKLQRSTTAWVRRYNAEGRYQIWYAHDSC